jgi:hypothetical protein
VYDPILLDYADGLGKEPVPSDIRLGTYAWGQWVEGKKHRFRLIKGDLSKGGGTRFQVNFQSHQAMKNEYFGKAKVEPWKKQASLLYLTIETNNIAKGRRYLDKLMEVYLRQNLELKNQTSLNTVNFIDRELSGISDSLQTTESRLEQFRSANRTVNISSEYLASARLALFTT